MKTIEVDGVELRRNGESTGWCAATKPRSHCIVEGVQDADEGQGVQALGMSVETTTVKTSRQVETGLLAPRLLSIGSLEIPSACNWGWTKRKRALRSSRAEFVVVPASQNPTCMDTVLNHHRKLITERANNERHMRRSLAFQIGSETARCICGCTTGEQKVVQVSGTGLEVAAVSPQLTGLGVAEVRVRPLGAVRVGDTSCAAGREDFGVAGIAFLSRLNAVSTAGSDASSSAQLDPAVSGPMCESSAAISSRILLRPLGLLPSWKTLS